jgi:hypothetical protein
MAILIQFDGHVGHILRQTQASQILSTVGQEKTINYPPSISHQIPNVSKAIVWVNYNDLTLLPHWNHGFYREFIPRWPSYSG